MSQHPFSLPTADVFLPRGGALEESLGRVTCLGVGAHQDDLEFMAFHGIIECFHSDEKWFGGVTCTDGAGSSRIGDYADKTDEEMRAIRRVEQRQAADVGRYAAMIQLDHPSRAVKAVGNPAFSADLEKIFTLTRAEVVYTHNPADKHETHVGVLGGVLRALRALPADQRPKRLLGCEVWRDLDWLDDSEKVGLNVSGHENLAAALNGIFDSQIAGGKRYDLAVMGRRRANATFFKPHASDNADMLAFAMDLTPLIQDTSMDPIAFVEEKILRFRDSVTENLRSVLEG